MRSILITITLVFIMSSTGLEAQDQLTLGTKISFKAVDDNGSKWNSQDHLGRYMVVYFYPAAMTGGCTAQACGYRDQSSALNDLDAMVVGVSGDEAENLRLFRKAHALNFTLLSDPKGNVAKVFGVPVSEGGKISREVDGRPYELVRNVTTSRWTFILDPEGKLVYKNTEVRAAEDPGVVIQVLKDLKGI